MPIYFSKIPSSNIRLRQTVYAYKQSNSGTDIALRGTVGPLSYYNENAGLNRWQCLSQGGTGTNKTLGYYSGLAHIGYVRMAGGSLTLAAAPSGGYGAWQGTSWQAGDSLIGFNNYSEEYMGSITAGIVNSEGPSGRIYGLRQFVSNFTRYQLCVRMTYINGTAPAQSHLQSVVWINTTDFPSGGATSPIELTGASASFSSHVIGADYTGVWVWNSYFIESNYWIGLNLT